jgi:hypothetical protein
MKISVGETFQFEFDFEIDRNAKNELLGFTLLAEKQGVAKFFCQTFLRALADGQASIGLSHQGLVLRNELCPYQPADFCIILTKKDLLDFQKLCEAGGALTVYPIADSGLKVVYD